MANAQNIHSMKRHSLEPRIWSSVLRGLLTPMAEHHINVDELLRDNDISAEELGRSNGEIPLKKYLQVLEHAARVAEDPLLGIRLARFAGPQTLGAIGFLFLSSRTLLEALDNLCHYINLLQDFTQARIVRGKEETAYVYQLMHTADMDCRQDVEFSITLTARLIRIYGGSAARITAVCFDHSPLANKIEYERLLRAPVFFNHQHNQLIIPADTNNIGTQVLDPSLAPILKEFLDRELEQYQWQQTFADQVERLLYSGQIRPPVTGEKVAWQLGISRATLFRRLADQGLSFQHLLDVRNHEMACSYLAASNMNVTQIAHQIGFSEGASFSRAFSRWSGGLSPSQYRKSSRK